MKTLFLISVLLILSIFSVKAQKYFPFVENKKQWNQATILYYFPIPNYRIITTHSFKFTQDTVSYNGKTYNYLFECNTNPLTGNWGYQIAGYGYREENKKVYRSEYYEPAEEVIYDFSLKVGDSVYVDSIYYFPTYAHVASVDSVLAGDSFRKRIQFDNPPDIWIEGIGSLYSPFNPIRWCMQMGSGSDLLCASDSTGNIYMNPEYNSCYLDTIFTHRENMISENLVRIINNPMLEYSIIQIDNDFGEYIKYELINSSGLLVRNGIISTREFIIFRNGLSSGLYMINFFGNTKKVAKKLMIK